jgi:hypothetical protein
MSHSGGIKTRIIGKGLQMAGEAAHAAFNPIKAFKSLKKLPSAATATSDINRTVKAVKSGNPLSMLGNAAAAVGTNARHFARHGSFAPSDFAKGMGTAVGVGAAGVVGTGATAATMMNNRKNKQFNKRKADMITSIMDA